MLLRLVGEIKLHKDALALVLCVTNDNVEASRDWHHHTQGSPGRSSPCTSFEDDEPTCGQGGSAGGTTVSQTNTCSITADELALICTMHGRASLTFSGYQSVSCEKLYCSAGLPGAPPGSAVGQLRTAGTAAYGCLARSNSVQLSPN